MNDIYLLTGGNIGDRLRNLQEACRQVETTVGLLVKRSSIYETAAWGYTDQEPFLNQVLCISSDAGPEELLNKLLQIELELGRKRDKKMGPRVIDLDILFYNNQIISTPDLIVPHPRMADRRFVLTPLNEIAPSFIHPVFNKSVHTLLLECPDQLNVNIYQRAG